jgi:RNA polymerase sigma-70 factor (ECF subfamily)
MAAIAREHLALCFSCVLRNLDVKRGAALLLREVVGFSVAETAEILDASFGQVKNWIQDARAEMTERYAESCALITKRGVCYQCVELDDFFNGSKRNPLEGTDGALDARLALVRGLPPGDINAWHKELLGILGELE